MKDVPRYRLAILPAHIIRLNDLLLGDVHSHSLHAEVVVPRTSPSKKVGEDATYIRGLFSRGAATDVEVYLENDEAECNSLEIFMNNSNTCTNRFIALTTIGGIMPSMMYSPLDPTKNDIRSASTLVAYKAPLSMTTMKTGKRLARPPGIERRV